MNRDEAFALYRQMLLIRRFEERCARLYQESKIRGFLHLYVGEEAVAAASWKLAELDPLDPRHIHVQMTTFREHREISEAVIRALCLEIREAGVPATIWLGSSKAEDERKIARHLKLVGDDLDVPPDDVLGGDTSEEEPPTER